jgi:hypothetical protein
MAVGFVVRQQREEPNMANAGHGMGGKANGQQGAKSAGVTEPGELLDEHDLASDLKNNHQLSGQSHDRGSTRQAAADEKGETDGLIESFEKLDKDVRAERDLGKKTHNAA